MLSVFLARIANSFGKLSILQGNISSASGVASLLLAQMLNIPDTIKNLQLGRKFLLVQPWTDWSRIILVLFVVSQAIELNPVINICIAVAAAATVLAIILREMVLYFSKDRGLYKNMAKSNDFTVDRTFQENMDRQVEKEKIKAQDLMKKHFREEYEAEIDVLESRLRGCSQEKEKSEINEEFYSAKFKYQTKIKQMIKSFPTWAPKTDYSEYTKQISIWRTKHSTSTSGHSEKRPSDTINNRTGTSTGEQEQSNRGVKNPIFNPRHYF